MQRRSYLGMLILLLLIADLAFGASAPPYRVKSTQNTLATVTRSHPAPAVNLDGYQKTVAFFQICKNKAAEIEKVLKELHAKSEAAYPDDKAKFQDDFLKRLTDQYPGSSYDGRIGTVPFNEFFVVTFTSSLRVDSVKELGKIILEYLVTRDRIQLTSFANSVTILLDQTNPARSSFINVAIPAIKEDAEKIVLDPDRKSIAAESPEAAVLNDAYQLLSLTNNQRMDIFAADVIREPEMQEKTLRVAAKGFKERHPEIYQTTDPTKARKKSTAETKPNKPAEQRFYQGVIRTVLLFLSATGVLIVVYRGILAATKRSAKKVNMRRQGRYRGLSPMVLQQLEETGRSVWGRNFLWVTRYFTYERRNRWVLCDGKEDKENKVFKARTKIEVSLRSNYFKVKLTRLNGTKSNIWTSTFDLSTEELRQGLEMIIQEMKNPSGKDYGLDDEDDVESATLAASSASPPDLPATSSTAPAH
jgi:hypothetical protein